MKNFIMGLVIGGFMGVITGAVVSTCFIIVDTDGLKTVNRAADMYGNRPGRDSGENHDSENKHVHILGFTND